MEGLEEYSVEKGVTSPPAKRSGAPENFWIFLHENETFLVHFGTKHRIYRTHIKI